MKKFLTITIDVEPDCSSDWTYSSPLTFTGVEKGIKDILHPLFIKYDLVPTYLLNNVVIENEASVAVLRELEGAYELGTHLHPEFIAPEKSFDNYAGKKARANCCDYPNDIEEGKLNAITDLFESKFGYKPIVFRAGRFAAGVNTIRVLKKLGYKVDTSVTPHIKWDDHTRKNICDFKNAPEQPYFMTDFSMIEKSKLSEGILQIPVSIALQKIPYWKEWLFSLGGLRRKPYYFKRTWLRPSFFGDKELQKLVKQYQFTYQGEEIIVYNMMFHNIEVMPGINPYAPTQKDCDQILAAMESFFAFCKEEGIRGISTEELYDRYYAKPSKAAKPSLVSRLSSLSFLPYLLGSEEVEAAVALFSELPLAV
ncbi:MAG: hypothetical protein K2P88_13805 [Chitinophagaceae bacterium]|uniref:hypothetical protein n=1 Tax=unclassified Paraflavitalea TaxID=2798305 RepID=UPI003D340FD5|nr:hypothetical protein [Chitinophagaceae bacterium]